MGSCNRIPLRAALAHGQRGFFFRLPEQLTVLMHQGGITCAFERFGICPFSLDSHCVLSDDTFRDDGASPSLLDDIPSHASLDGVAFSCGTPTRPAYSGGPVLGSLRLIVAPTLFEKRLKLLGLSSITSSETQPGTKRHPSERMERLIGGGNCREMPTLQIPKRSRQKPGLRS